MSFQNTDGGVWVQEEFNLKKIRFNFLCWLFQRDIQRIIRGSVWLSVLYHVSSFKISNIKKVTILKELISVIVLSKEAAWKLLLKHLQLDQLYEVE